MLDEYQRAVVDHPGGPLLVLAGPGTGKTTTIVETIVDRVENRGVDPDRVLVLTFSRKAAGELRERISARLRRTTRTPLALTFHSYANALLRREAVLSDEMPPRLLSGPEQLLEVRRLLQGELSDGGGYWPERLRPALATRGFAEELRDFLLRAAERGIDGPELVRLGRDWDRDDWEAAGRFSERYYQRFDLDLVPAVDYGELIREAAGLLSDGEVRRRERAAYDVVLVDEYQDTDPAQEYLLRQLAGEGRDLIVVGDPDQSIYGFRGADVNGIMRFPERFRTRDGAEAAVIALRVCRRSGPALLEASRRVARRLPQGPGRHRDIAPFGDGEPGEVRIVVADSVSQEAQVVADALRRAHLLDGVPWSRMVVLVRSATRQIPLLRRALASAGVPVVLAGDEVPLSAEPGVRPLITTLRVAVRPETLDEATAEELLTGPLGGTDAIGVRRLRRALRNAEREAEAEADGEYVPRRAGGELLVAAVTDPRELLRIEEVVAAPAARIAHLVAGVRDLARQGKGAEELLWALWQESGLAERWTEVSLAGGARGAQADRDLDAVVALFDHVARFVDRLPKAGAGVFLDDLVSREISGDTLAKQAPDGEAVRILSAHKSKGLEWDLVVVAGVQEGVWPDLRLRGSLLGVDELIERSTMPPGDGDLPSEAVSSATLASKMLAEERRLFYVAVTRARSRLLVTAVDGEDTDDRPSRFLTELLPPGTKPEQAEGLSRWLSMNSLVADLRATVADPSGSAPMRRAAAAHLARLARSGVQGAHPDTWYALTPLSDESPLPWPDGVIQISPSTVEGFTKCGLRWLLETAVGAGSGDVVRHLGTVIHAIAVLAATEEPTEEGLFKRLDDIWESLDFGGVWFNRKQRDVAKQMIRRFLAWQAANPRQLVDVEKGFTAELPGADDTQILIKGRVDRVERDEEGRAFIVDLKTGAGKPGQDELTRHPQLGVYQLATELGAFRKRGLTVPGGAALVQVGKAASREGAVEQGQRPLGDDPEPAWARELVETVASGMLGPEFSAMVNDGCRSCAVRGCCPVNEQGGQVC
nr:ATP-dependent DNA helicase [Rhizohabitans arisaemae]